MKTQEQIQDMIKKLLKEKASLPQFNYFGDNNWEIYDTAIEVLEQNLNEDDIYGREYEYYVETFALLVIDWVYGVIQDNELIDIDDEKTL